MAAADHRMARFEQGIDDAVPARGLGEGAVDENDGGLHEKLLSGWCWDAAVSRARGEAVDECERPFGHLAPAAVDGERVTAVGDLFDLGDSGVVPLALERCVCDRPRHRVVFLSIEDQQRPAIRVLGVQLCLGPRVQIGVGHLHQRHAWRRHVVGLVQPLGLLVVEGIRPAVLELVQGESDGAAPVQGVSKHGARRPQRCDRQRQHTAKRSGIDRHRCHRQTPVRDDLRQESAGRVAHDRGLLLQPPDHLRDVIGDLAERLSRENLGVRPGLCDRLGIVGPARGQRGIARVLEELGPVVPAARKHPEPVDEHDRRPPTCVGLLDLSHFPLGEPGRVSFGGLHEKLLSGWG